MIEYVSFCTQPSEKRLIWLVTNLFHWGNIIACPLFLFMTHCVFSDVMYLNHNMLFGHTLASVAMLIIVLLYLQHVFLFFVSFFMLTYETSLTSLHVGYAIIAPLLFILSFVRVGYVDGHVMMMYMMICSLSAMYLSSQYLVYLYILGSEGFHRWRQGEMDLWKIFSTE